jgi:hypothetical protein
MVSQLKRICLASAIVIDAVLVWRGLLIFVAAIVLSVAGAYLTRLWR